MLRSEKSSKNRQEFSFQTMDLGVSEGGPKSASGAFQAYVRARIIDAILTSCGAMAGQK